LTQMAYWGLMSLRLGGYGFFCLLPWSLLSLCSLVFHWFRILLSPLNTASYASASFNFSLYRFHFTQPDTFVRVM
jgi:hypothetical protein